jgi:hypothetical protein
MKQAAQARNLRRARLAERRKTLEFSRFLKMGVAMQQRP